MVRRVAGRAGVTVEAVDVDADDDLVKEYGIRIPVVLAPDDTVLAEGIIEERPFRSALRRSRRAHRRA